MRSLIMRVRCAKKRGLSDTFALFCVLAFTVACSRGDNRKSVVVKAKAPAQPAPPAPPPAPEAKPQPDPAPPAAPVPEAAVPPAANPMPATPAPAAPPPPSVVAPPLRFTPPQILPLPEPPPAPPAPLAPPSMPVAANPPPAPAPAPVAPTPAPVATTPPPTPPTPAPPVAVPEAPAIIKMPPAIPPPANPSTPIVVVPPPPAPPVAVAPAPTPVTPPEPPKVTPPIPAPVVPAPVAVAPAPAPTVVAPAPATPTPPQPQVVAPPVHAVGDLRNDNGKRHLSTVELQKLNAGNANTCFVYDGNRKYISSVYTLDSGVFVDSGLSPSAGFLNGWDLNEIGSKIYGRIFERDHVEATYDLKAQNFRAPIKKQMPIVFNVFSGTPGKSDYVRGADRSTFYVNGACPFLGRRADLRSFIGYLLFLEDKSDLIEAKMSLAKRNVQVPDFATQVDRFEKGVYTKQGCLLQNYQPDDHKFTVRQGYVAILGSDTASWILELDNKFLDLSKVALKAKRGVPTGYEIYVPDRSIFPKETPYLVKANPDLNHNDIDRLSLLYVNYGADADSMKLIGDACPQWFLSKTPGPVSWPRFTAIGTYLQEKYPTSGFPEISNRNVK